MHSDGLITEFRNETVEVRQQSHILKNVCGQIKLVGAPYYGLVLDHGSYISPIIPIDSARDLVHWISSVGKRVMINQLLSVCEDFQFLKKDLSIKHQNFIVSWKDVKTLKENSIQLQDSEHHEVSETKNNITFIKTPDIEQIIRSQRTCRVLVHHVSIPFCVDENESASCLVFVSYSNSNHVESKLWLVLRADQVVWREFLVPNREYLIHFPPEINGFFFDKSQKPLDTIMEKNIRELRVIFHHKILFSKHSIVNGSIVPAGSKLFLSRNTSFSEYVYRFTADSLWFRSWFSTSEADHASAPLVTFYGKVTSVIYLEEEIYKSCYLCIRKKHKEPELVTPKNTVSQSWMDPFKTGLVLEENDLIELPNVTDDGDNRMKTGVPAEMVQVIKLQDMLTGEERSIYIKHSYVSSCQQLMRLASGMVVCISHLNRRCSSAGKYYYITTMLSCCRVLDYMVKGEQSEGWGLYGLCQMTQDPQLKTWGVLEPFNVTKVAIRAKCNYCRALFFEAKCSNYCAGMGTYTTSAYAIAWINIIHDNKTITMEKVLIKDNLVQKLLCIPENIWLLLKEVASQEEIIAFRDQAFDETSLTPLRKMFQMFCNLKSRGKCYLSVKKLSTQEEGDLFYCINLEPINKDRLHIIAELVAKTTKS